MKDGFLRRALGELCSPAMVVALLALTLSIGGSAYAAKLITSKNIKNNTVSTQDLRNGGVTTKDLKNNGVTTRDVRDGSLRLSDLGPDVKAAISDSWDPSSTLVSGKTITGSVYYVIDASFAGQALNQSIAFPARAPVALGRANFAADSSAVTTDDDATCTGTYDAPTAPAGALCAYRTNTGNLTSINASTLFPGEDRGFVIRALTAAAGPATVDLSWAYTAP